MSLSLWLDPLPAARPPLEGTVEVDALVIGGGLCGASAAWHLARAGVSVALVEGRRVAMSASGRNAGFILQGTAERYDRAVEVMGRARARTIHAWSVENHRMITEFLEKNPVECGYMRRGSLQLADSEEEERSLEASAALLEEDGFDARTQGAAELPEVFRQAGYRRGVWLPGDGELDPARFVRGLAGAAEAAGARVFEQSPILGVEAGSAGEARAWVGGAGGDRAVRGEVRASVLLICTNARLTELVPSLQGCVDPVRGQMLGTAPLPPGLFPCPVYANHGYDYWRQDEHGRVALGGWRNLDPGTEIGHDEILNDGIQSRMEGYLRRYAPDLQITHRWSGIMGFSRDGLPLVGPARGLPGALVAGGFTGHGFGFAFLAGAALAAIVQEGRHPFAEAVDARRFSV